MNWDKCDRCGKPATLARDAFVKIIFVHRIVNAHLCLDCAAFVENEVTPAGPRTIETDLAEDR